MAARRVLIVGGGADAWLVAAGLDAAARELRVHAVADAPECE